MKGLTTRQAEESRRKNGSNALTEKEIEGFWKKYLESFNDPIIKILLVALCLNLVFVFLGKSPWYESLGIAVAVLLATLVGTISEYKNEGSFKKLQEDAAKIKVKVIRDGYLTEISIDDVVVGDVIKLESGDKVPADGKLIQGNIAVDQSSLNGESKEAKKRAFESGEIGKEEIMNPYLVFRGTTVSSGEAYMEVLMVGDYTIYGKLAQELQNSEEVDGPLKVKLGTLAHQISIFGYTGGILIAIAYLINKSCIQNNFMTYIGSGWGTITQDLIKAIIMGVVIIVVAVPEGLPMMINMVLAQNMKKMLKDNVLVRQMTGIETAGSLNILFSDKTGTITKGILEAVNFTSGFGKEYSSIEQIENPLKRVVVTNILGNTTASLDGNKVIGGNATEKAVLAFIKQNRDTISFSKKQTIPFNSQDKYSTTLIEGEIQGWMLKGAPEKILANCTMYYDTSGKKQVLGEKEKKQLEEKMDELAKRAIRVLALATAQEGKETEACLVGIIGIRDEIRKESSDSIAKCLTAGIQVVMVTGDKKETAIAIAKEVGLLKEPTDKVYTSEELNVMSDEEVKKQLKHIRVIARALPTDKSRLVRLSQELGLVCGMTGDGVNDAPALKQADVGFAMGSGTEVAKEAAKINILDNNFASIAKAVLYGRTIYKSIQRFVVYQLTINVAALLICFIGPFIGVENPLTVIQMLFVNLVMDTLAALAFGGAPALVAYMNEKPKARNEKIVSIDMWEQILVASFYVTIVSVCYFLIPQVKQIFLDETTFYTGFFTLFILFAVMNSLNTRTTNTRLLEGILENKMFIYVMSGITIMQVIMVYVGGNVLRTEPLHLVEWVFVISIAFTIIPIDVLRKVIRDYVGKVRTKRGSYGTKRGY